MRDKLYMQIARPTLGTNGEWYLDCSGCQRLIFIYKPAPIRAKCSHCGTEYMLTEKAAPPFVPVEIPTAEQIAIAALGGESCT